MGGPIIILLKYSHFQNCKDLDVIKKSASQRTNIRDMTLLMMKFPIIITDTVIC